MKLNCHFSWQAQLVFGEIWNDSRSAQRCIFPYKMRMASAKGNLSCAAGCRLTVSWSDHGRNGLGTVSDRSRIVNDVSAVFSKFLSYFGYGHFSWQAQYIWLCWRMRPVAPRIVNSVSCVKRIIIMKVILRGRHNIW